MAPIQSWSWDFQNDGSVDSTRANPSFTYALPGIYSVRLSVVDAASNHSSVVQERLIRVGGVAAFPFRDSFENGLLDPAWEAWSEYPQGRVEVVSGLGGPSYDGVYHALLDRRSSGPPSTNQLTLHIDLAGAPDAQLSYAFKETADEDDPEDGCFISADGVNWYLVHAHHGGAAHWTRIEVDLGAAAAAAGIAFGSDFRIRFQQRDDFPVPADGVQLDAVAVTRRGGRVELYGTACSAPRGTPLISASGGAPNLGNPLFALHLGNSAPSSACLLLGGTRRDYWAAAGLPLPIDLTPIGAAGCWIHAAAEASVGLGTDPTGHGATPMPVPAQPSLAGTWFYFQWLVIDPTVAGLPLVSSAGLAARLGMD
jgi:PKD repeat protein